MKNYYAILEVPPTATMDQIKHSYRRLARLHHPDLNAQALDIHIKRLNEAYSVLSDPVKRARYDEQWRAEQERQAELHRKQEQAKREAEMTWLEGIAGFVVELKKALKDES